MIMVSEQEIDVYMKTVWDHPCRTIDGTYIAFSETARKVVDQILATEQFNRELFSPMGLAKLFKRVDKVQTENAPTHCKR